jgi:Carbon-nitrogen hydrolase
VIERSGGRLYNSAVVLEHGRVTGVYRKTHLTPGETLLGTGDEYPVFEVKGLRYGINICYDTQFADAAARVAGQGARPARACPEHVEAPGRGDMEAPAQRDPGRARQGDRHVAGVGGRDGRARRHARRIRADIGLEPGRGRGRSGPADGNRDGHRRDPDHDVATPCMIGRLAGIGDAATIEKLSGLTV